MVIRNQPAPAPGKRVHLHVGSGRLGACFAEHGLMQPAPETNVMRVGETVLMHAGHWHSGIFGIDHHLPVARVCWAQPPIYGSEGWAQSLDPAIGLLQTRWKGCGAEVEVRATCHPNHPDHLALAIEGSRIPPVLIEPLREWTTCYGEKFRGASAVYWKPANPAGSLWSARVRMGSADSLLAVSFEGSCRVEPDRRRLRVSFPTRAAVAVRILIGVCPWSHRKTFLAAWPGGDFFHEAGVAWKRRWAGVSFRNSDPRLAKLGNCSLYHLLCAFAPGGNCPPPPMGWTGNGWGFHFPQDISYIHPVLLQAGWHDLARGVVDFYASRLSQTEESTRRIYGLPGAMWAWEFPIGENTRILPDGKAPNPFHYEIHNAAYPARMALETALALRDDQWSRQLALPVILGSAEFFTAALKRGRDGLWGIHVRPSMGQDEFGGENAPDYLCALFAAAYTLRAALKITNVLRMRHPSASRWRKILADGLAFPRLLERASGVYATSRAPGWRLHRQKHPVQLSPYIFLPQPSDGPTRRAYEIRHALCANDRPDLRHPGAGGSYYDGWTLFAYALACARTGDCRALHETLAEIEIAQLTDHEHLQIYESSGFWKPFYTTSMGLFLQALLDHTREIS